MAITLGQICDAIGAVLATATGIETLESYDEISEGLNAADLPLLQVYWESLSFVSDTADRVSFRGGIRHKRIVIHVDVFASQRSHMNEDMKAIVDGADTLLVVLEGGIQDVKPYFNLDGIKGWELESATRGEFDYAGAKYMGARFVLIIHVF